MAPCTDCDLGYGMFWYTYFGKPQELFNLCVRHGLILASRDCDRCGQPALLDFNKKHWRCNKFVSLHKKKRARCGWSESVYKNTMFENVHLDIETLLLFINLYLRNNFSYGTASEEFTGLSQKSICEWSRFCREVLIEWCLKNETNFTKIGGHGKIVELDESKFGERKYNGSSVEGQWVYGGVCRETRECFMVPVEQHDNHTLLEVIKDHIEPGTQI